MKVILGSSSPRRRSILSSVYHSDFTVTHPDVDETILQGEKPSEHCLRLAESKLAACLSSASANTVVICADTIVTLDDMIFGKPASYDEAISFLSQLQGRSHYVLSALAIAVKTHNTTIISKICRTRVEFRKLSLSQIKSYLLSIEYQDKAGAYAIQDQGSMIIDTIDGSLSNVIGFPVRLYFSLLFDIGAVQSLYPGHEQV